MTDRHATTEELLALRDGEASAWTTAHAAACETCAAELFRLEQMRARLRALPGRTPPRDRWPVVARRVERDRRVRRLRAVLGVAAALAAVGAGTVLVRHGPDRAAADAAALDRAMVRSQALEQTLRAMAPETRALPADAAEAVAALEDRLARIDAQLADPRAWRGGGGEATGLWQQRAGVLSALVDIHATRTARAGL